MCSAGCEGVNGIELRARREALGLNQTDLAELLGVKQSTVSTWESGRRSVPAGVSGELNVIEEQVESIVDLAAEMLDATSERPVRLRVWADDESFWLATDYEPLPAACYRVAMARARLLADDPNSTFIALA